MNQPSAVRLIQRPASLGRGELESGRSAQAQVYQVYGRAEFQGSGETTFETNFPIWFVEPPHLSFGGELGGNQGLTAGNFPRINVMIRRWLTTTRDTRLYYIGAEFILVADGPRDMIGIAHWQCEGTGLSNPLFTEGSL